MTYIVDENHIAFMYEYLTMSGNTSYYRPVMQDPNNRQYITALTVKRYESFEGASAILEQIARKRNWKKRN